MELLNLHKNGLSNAQISRELRLESDSKGGQKNFLTYSLLGGLLRQKKVEKCEHTKVYTLSNGR